MIIYKATNLINSKVYIGLTTRDLEARKQEHISHALTFNNNGVFGKAIRKYGKESFDWEIIDFAESIDELKDKERRWIQFYNSYIHSPNSNGYNLSLGGEGTEGYLQTTEHKRKIAKALTGNKNAVGTKNGKSKLSETDVLKIKSLIKEGMTLAKIAKEYDVSSQTISKIKHGLRWSHLTDCEVRVGDN